ncbi:MAG: nicotinate-nucleotide adenylyltransferase [bacterium]|nr:MAG: nicotinate-nucleotide adenylyltransferase [bacterium]
MRKIGLFGGTFDPIHNGHLIISEYLREELVLDEIWFIPARVHALKNNEMISPPEVRKAMLELAISENRYFKCSDVELVKEGISYTIETLDSLHQMYSSLNPKFYFFIGMDNVDELPLWKKPAEILTKCQVIAFGRPGFKPSEKVKPFLPHLQFLHIPLLEISSTFIRLRVGQGKSIRYLVPDSVMHYIKENQLYTRPGK